MQSFDALVSPPKGRTQVIVPLMFLHVRSVAQCPALAGRGLSPSTVPKAATTISFMAAGIVTTQIVYRVLFPLVGVR